MNDILNITIDLNDNNNKIVFGTMEKLFKNNKISNEEINKLLDEDYSKKLFHIGYPLLKEVPANSKEEDIRKLSKDNKGNWRYYFKKNRQSLLSDKYLLCTHWADDRIQKNITGFIKWLKKLPNVSITITPITKEEILTLLFSLSKFEDETLEKLNCSYEIFFNIVTSITSFYDETELRKIKDDVSKYVNDPIGNITIDIEKFGIDTKKFCDTNKLKNIRHLNFWRKLKNFKKMKKFNYLIKKVNYFKNNNIQGNNQTMSNTENTNNNDQDFLTEEEIFILIFSLLKFENETKEKIGYENYTDKAFFEDIYRVKDKDWNVEITSFSEVKTKLRQRMEERPTPRSSTLGDKVYNEYKDSDFNAFEIYINKFIYLRNTYGKINNFLTKKEIHILIFSLAKFETETQEKLGYENFSYATFYEDICSLKDKNWDIKKTSFSDIKKQFRQSITNFSNSTKTHVEEETYNEYKDSDFNAFEIYIDKFLALKNGHSVLNTNINLTKNKIIDTFVLREIDTLTEDQVYILALFMAKYSESAIYFLTETQWDETEKIIASKTNDYSTEDVGIIRSSFDPHFENGREGLLNREFSITEEDIYKNYGKYTMEEFKKLIFEFSQNEKTRNIIGLEKNEVCNLLFLTSQYKDEILNELNYTKSNDIYKLIIKTKLIDDYDDTSTLRRMKFDITQYIEGTCSTISPEELKIICNENKNFEDFRPLIDKVKLLQTYIDSDQEDVEFYQENLHIDTEVKEVQKLEVKKQEITKASPIDKPHNRIIYGAPGTGKSYLLNKETDDYKENTMRVTFYDGYTHGQFVGSYKPVPIKNDDSITYKYVAGPLMKSIVNAINNPGANHILIIEEINRARADKVFGNTFQLLDRKEGESEYSIDLSDEQKDFLQEKLEENNMDKLFFPSNLYIWATMNSADQGVYILDSAFKRRWNFEHVGLDENEEDFSESNKTYKITYNKSDHIEWNSFRKIINDLLMDQSIVEDKLLAPFFIKPKDFSQNTFILQEDVFIGKILMYLFDDILKHKPKSILFLEELKTFSKLKEAYKNGKDIFQDEIINLFKSSDKSSAEEPSAEELSAEESSDEPPAIQEQSTNEN